jgi:epsilon-lactone hydrolase
MPLAQAREADTRAEDFTAEPAAAKFPPAAEVDGLWAETPDAQPGRAILYLFGGGFVLGSPATRRKTAGHLAVAAKTRVLVPNYRLAPEHPFPAALDDAVRAYEWLLTQGAEPSKTVVAGDSAGGGLAVSTVIAVRDCGLPMPAGIVALSPWADLTCSGDSMSTRAAADIECTRAGLLEMAGWYLGGRDPRQPLASPILRGFPLFSASLAGMQHVFPIWAGAFPEADAAIALIGNWVQVRTGGCVPSKEASGAYHLFV